MRSAAISFVMVVLMGCSYDSSGGVGYPANDAATVELSLASIDPMKSAGDTQTVTAIVKDANQSPISAPAVVWRTNAPSVATVSGSGDHAIVTAVDDGTATITATSGRVEGTVNVTVHRRVVAIELSAKDSVVVAGTTTQLTVLGRDARHQAIAVQTGISFATSNAFSVAVSPSGLATALFSSFTPFDAIITATVSRDGETLSATTHIVVASAAPQTFDFSAGMAPEGVRPEPVNSAADGIIFLTRDGGIVHYKLLWSLLEAAPISAHIHGPDGNDAVAGILVDLPLGDQTGKNGTLTGSFTAADIHSQGGKPPISLDSLVTLMSTPTLAYVDIHTASFPDGEIRGLIFRHPTAY